MYVCTWVDAEAVLQVRASHAGHCVCDCVHVREELHGTQWIFRCTAIHTHVVILVTLERKRERETTAQTAIKIWLFFA